MTAVDPPRTVGRGESGDVDPDDPVTGLGWLKRHSRAITTGAVVALGSTAAGSLVGAITAVDSPVAGVARQVIDSVPQGVRKWAISTFGTDDKLVLGIGIVVILTVCASLIAHHATRRRWLVPAGIVVFTVVGLMAVKEVGPGELFAAGASALAAYVAFAVLVPFVGKPGPRLVPIPMRSVEFTTSPSDAGPAGQSTGEPDAPVAEPMVIHRWEAPVDRRQFVRRAGGLWAGTAVMAGVAGAINRADDRSVVAATAKFPKVRAGSPDAAPAPGPGATADPGVTPFVTPNGDFYRIDTAYVAPRVTLDDWRLTIHGAVDTPLSLTYDQLLDRHVVERYVTLCCVSNEVGGNLVGNAKFIGVPLAELLEEVGVRPEGTQVAMTSVDGWTCGFPTKLAMDGRDAIVAIGMNGEPLPIEHGFPVRLVVPGLYGYVSATKWLTDIELVGLDDFDGYWIPRGWSKDGPVKTQSRIDVPSNGASVQAGKVAVAGIAFAQHRGIAKVEVRIDDGPWVEARLADEYTIDTWRQWVLEWDARRGSHTIAVRATDDDGATQPAERTDVAPNGATGHHTIEVEVA
ncbi:MAG: molybdopterin-dependent oxidoreductase [Acidimicrobiales bacterium]